MGDVTQQSWFFAVGDGQEEEIFTDLEGMYEAPEIDPKNKTTRDATTITHAANSTTKKKRFNRMSDGQQITVSLDYMPGETGQDRLTAMHGDDDGVNCRYGLIGTEVRKTWTFNVLVEKVTYKPAASNDEAGVDKVEYTLSINSDIDEEVGNVLV